MDLIQDGVLWRFMVDRVILFGNSHIETNGDVLLFDNQEMAEHIAEFLHVLGYDTVEVEARNDWEPGRAWYSIDVV